MNESSVHGIEKGHMQAAENARHDYRDQPGGRAPRCAHCKVVTFDAPWEFVVTWDPAVGQAPAPVQRLFRHRGTLDHERGRAVLQSDQGHTTYYVRAVNDYLAKYAPGRQGDLVAVATEVACEPSIPPGSAEVRLPPGIQERPGGDA